MGRAKKTYSPQKRGEALVSDYKKVFSTPSGRRVLTDLMNQYHMFQSSLLGAKTTDVVLVHEGQRDVVLHILSKMNVNLEAYEKIIKDSQQEDSVYDN